MDTEQRKQIARRLRDNAGEDPSWLVPWAVFNDGDEHSPVDVANALADAIDPVGPETVSPGDRDEGEPDSWERIGKEGRRMSHTETQAVTYYSGHSVEINGKRYVAEHVSIPKVCHGDHGPEPRFPGDAWTTFHICGLCDEPVSRPDNYCRHCGARLDWKRACGADE